MDNRFNDPKWRSAFNRAQANANREGKAWCIYQWSGLYYAERWHANAPMHARIVYPEQPEIDRSADGQSK